jgi:1-pyrroline-5-carboxylate dehydrogenase
MVTEQRDQKITYTTMSVEQAEAFNQAYDAALQRVTGRLGSDYPLYIAGQAREAERPLFESRSPNDTTIVIGRFQDAAQAEVEEAVRAARAAFPGWAHTGWRERLAVLRRAADNFRARKYDIAAWLTLEAGKPRLEAMGEVEEAADLITTYSDQMEEHDGFVITLNQLSPQEVNHSVLRPYGVWAVVAPFNFPVALATGMVAAALIAGNTVVFKPSQDTPMCGLLVYQCLVDAGLPAGALNVLTGGGDETGKLLTHQPLVDAVAFIGSVPVGTSIFREFTRDHPRPVIAEMGGKNPVIVTEHADLEKAVEGTARAAFGYSGQKCSAASRVYVHDAVADDFLRRLVQRTTELVVGDPTRADVFTGPVITEDAYHRFEEVCDVAHRDGKVLAGGCTLTDDMLAHGYYCGLTVCALPGNHRFFREELFVPFLAVTRVHALDEALTLANDSPFGLTAGIFTEDRGQIQAFLDRMQAGVIYVNRKGGATTGAWPGVQSFGGWKASGSTGKSALGPYYVQQFMREQSQTVVSD